MTHFNWDHLHGQKDGFFRFYSEVIKFRKEFPLLGRAEFVGKGDVTWHEKDWANADSKFLAFTLHDRCDQCQ